LLTLAKTDMADPLANILAERGALTFNQAFAAARAVV
jgi:hypothetical protein